MPLYLPYLARAYAELDQFNDAWRCIGEAMTAVQTTKERWCEAEVNRIAGEIALKSPRRSRKAGNFERALQVRQQKPVPNPRAMSMGSGATGRDDAIFSPGLRLVY